MVALGLQTHVPHDSTLSLDPNESRREHVTPANCENGQVVGTSGILFHRAYLTTKLIPFKEMRDRNTGPNLPNCRACHLFLDLSQSDSRTNLQVDEACKQIAWLEEAPIWREWIVLCRPCSFGTLRRVWRGLCTLEPGHDRDGRMQVMQDDTSILDSIPARHQVDVV